MALTSFRVRLVTQVLLALPLAGLMWQWTQFVSGTPSRLAGLTSDPIAYTIDYLGLWALRMLIVTLCITPLARLSRKPVLAVARRIAGLWTIAYAALHLAVYFGLDLLGDLALLWDDVVKHPFILFGMSAFVLLVPLAFTSTQRWIRRLGPVKWRRLHWLIFPAALLASVHFIMRVKGFQIEPWFHAGIVSLLIGWRLTRWAGRQRARAAVA